MGAPGSGQPVLFEQAPPDDDQDSAEPRDGPGSDPPTGDTRAERTTPEDPAVETLAEALDGIEQFPGEPPSATVDAVSPEASGTSPEERRSAATKLLQLAAGVELFHTPAGEAFASLERDGHRETHPVHSGAFSNWLRHRYWLVYHQSVPSGAMTDAIATLAARSEFEGETYAVGIRIAAHEDRIYFDLANPAWQVVEIDAHGWRVVDEPLVKFRRPATMEALPTPVHGGSIELLRPFLNLKDEPDAWPLFVGVLVAAFRPTPPYLVLVLYGEQGTAKSTTTRILQLLVDPGQSPLRSEPKDQQDLLIAARNNWVVAFDNLSHLPGWLSDAICRLSTGGGLGKRQLYTDQDYVQGTA